MFNNLLAYKVLHQNIEDLIREIKRVEQQSEYLHNRLVGAITQNEKDTINKIIINKISRIINYNASVISLYGYLELFIEELIKEYLDDYCKMVPSFNQQTIKTKDSLFDGIIDISHKISHPKMKSHSIESLVELLYNAFFNDKNTLIPELFYQSGGNYNYKEISSSFSRLGMPLSEIRKYYPISGYIKMKGRERNSDESSCYEELNDLVARRNEIAHGASSSSLLSEKMMIEYAKMIDLFCQSLLSFVRDKLYEIVWTNRIDSANEPVVLGHIFHEKTAHVKMGKGSVNIGDKAICYLQGAFPHYHSIQVEDIQVNGVGVSSLILGGNEYVTMRFDSRVRKKEKVLFLK